jgi:hypothetical protein
MECNRLERFFSENEEGTVLKDGDLRKHVDTCRACKEYLLFTKVLHSQKEVFEHAPETLLLKVRQRINERVDRNERLSIFDIFKLIAKPAALACCLLLIATALFIHFRNSPIGRVNNLADRFNISEFREVKTGDILYVAKQIQVDLTMNGNTKVELDSNTVLQLRSRNKIALFRGQVHLAAGKNALKVETPNGIITLKDATIKVHTALKKENGDFKARTSCYVINGNVQIGTKRKTLVTPGQEITLAENGKVELKNSLPVTEQNDRMFRIDAPLKNKVFTAKEQLCDCLYDIRYNAADNPLHGKEMKENKFPVRIFWQNKEKYESMRRFDETVCYFNINRNNYSPIDIGPGI